MKAVKAKKASAIRSAAGPGKGIARARRPLAAALVAVSTMLPTTPAAAALAVGPADSGAAGVEGALTGGDWVFGIGGSWAYGAGWSYTAEEVNGSPDSASLETWMIEGVRRHWGLVEEDHVDPVIIVEQWVSGASSADYSLTTGADDRQACTLLLEGYEPPPGRGTKEYVLAGFLTQPSVCGRLWAAATVWEQSGAGENALEDRNRLAEALWRGAGFGSADGDGFGTIYYEPGTPPYCGHLPADVADDEVMFPVSCPRLYPSVQLCHAQPPPAAEEAAEAGAVLNGGHEVPPSSGSFDVPQCSAIERAMDGRPNSSQYKWTERWWDPDGNPVDSPAADSGVEDAGNCDRPARAGAGWVLSLCADEQRGSVLVRRNVLQADWFWTPPPPVRPRYETLLDALLPPEERSGIGEGEPRLNCDVPTSRLSRAEAERREARWVQVRNFRVDPCMVDATVALFDLAESHGIQLIVGPNGAGRTWGYQMYLRRNNCPAEWTDSQFANAPAPQCNPVTALPGKSRHNMGMAIDFNCNSFDHPCYRWLDKHATRLGFHDLPRSVNEPWHWAAAPPH